MAKKLRVAQILTLEKTAKAGAEQIQTRAHQVFQKKEPLSGIDKWYTALDPESKDTLPSESTHIQVRVKETVKVVREAFATIMDIQATKEHGNAIAKANVVVDGDVLFADVPVTLLLTWEKNLINWMKFVSDLPTLASDDVWHWDDANNCFSTEPKETVRVVNKKTVLPLTKATDKHPETVQVIDVPERAGTWTTVKRSGAIQASTVSKMLERAGKLRDAVKLAREEANTTVVEEQSVGKRFLDYIFEPLDK